MKTLEMLWTACPKETAACCAIAIACAAMMAVLIGLLAWPADPEKMEVKRYDDA